MAIGIKENGRNVKELLPPVRPAKVQRSVMRSLGASNIFVPLRRETDKYV